MRARRRGPGRIRKEEGRRVGGSLADRKGRGLRGAEELKETGRALSKLGGLGLVGEVLRSE